MIYKSDLEKAIAKRKQYKKLAQKLKKEPAKKLDEKFHEKHYEVFEEIDCLDCANCCKTTSPIFRDVDIKRLSSHLKMQEVDFINQYLELDNEHDYVLKSSPCVFLQDDNKCSVYEYRPLACREYPHTNRKKMHQILPLTRKNTEVCPAVSRIFESFL